MGEAKRRSSARCALWGEWAKRSFGRGGDCVVHSVPGAQEVIVGWGGADAVRSSSAHLEMTSGAVPMS